MVCETKRERYIERDTQIQTETEKERHRIRETWDWKIDR